MLTKLLWIFQIVFDAVVIILLFLLVSRRRVEREDIERVLGAEERLKVLVEDKVREMEGACEMVAYEKERAIKEIEKKSLEIEKKLKMITDTLFRKEKEKKQKRELVRHMLSMGKSPAEVASELGIPVSEVKLIAELLSKDREG